MRIVERFRVIEAELPEGWERARFRLTVQDEADAARTAALLGPANPGRHGRAIDFVTARGGGGVGPDRMRQLLRRIEREQIPGKLDLVEAVSPEPMDAAAGGGLAAQWDDAVAALPDDWSDLLVEVALPSTDYIEPGALRLSPVNPQRVGKLATFRFRAARKFGYGAAPEMVRRCMERLEEAGITGELRIVTVFSDTYPVKTQGPVWSARA